MASTPLSARDRLDSLVLGAISRLPPSVVSRLAGTPIEIDGQRLSPHAQLLLRLLELTGSGRFEELPVDEAREQVRRDAAVAAGRAIPVGRSEDLSLPGPAGHIPARLYVPAPTAPPEPLVVYFHGGGHVVGDLDSHDQPCRFLAREIPARVLAVDYRLGPEHRFPAAVDDARAAFAWAHANAGELGADPDRIAVAGDSAGGNLAAVVAVRAGAGDGPAPAYQTLIYPVTDYASERRSYELFAEGFFLTRRQMRWYRERYFGSEADREHPDASPLRAQSLAGLAPAYVVSAGFDPLRDEAEAYAAALREAGTEVTLRREPDLVHGFFNMVGMPGRAREASFGVVRALRDGLGVRPLGS